MVEAAPDATIATRERILDGAREAIALHGVAKLGMADICATSGMSRGTLYRYFGSREELLLELSRREAERFRDEVLAAAREAATPEEQLRLLLEQVTQEVQKNRALQRLLESDPARVLAAIRASKTCGSSLNSRMSQRAWRGKSRPRVEDAGRLRNSSARLRKRKSMMMMILI